MPEGLAYDSYTEAFPSHPTDKIAPDIEFVDHPFTPQTPPDPELPMASPDEVCRRLEFVVLGQDRLLDSQMKSRQIAFWRGAGLVLASLVASGCLQHAPLATTIFLSIMAGAGSLPLAPISIHPPGIDRDKMFSSGIPYIAALSGLIEDKNLAIQSNSAMLVGCKRSYYIALGALVLSIISYFVPVF